MFGYCNALVVRVLFVDHDVLHYGDMDGNSGCWTKVQNAQWGMVAVAIIFASLLVFMIIIWKKHAAVAPSGSDSVELTSAKEAQT